MVRRVSNGCLEEISVLGGSWYLLPNNNCTYNHIRALRGLISTVISTVTIGY